ncbi:MAG TPA: ABC transporter substrate-binding protein, partial [Burkholderiales bacterium]|nr:ABC transporter substrate-binding protein [Burkholderiales bacterium]
MTVSRRKFLQGLGAGVAAASAPWVAAQSEPIRIGLMTVKTGPLASGGLDMERALVMYLKERNYTLAGRKVALSVADTGGVPAQARTKLQELAEKDRIQVLIGPLDAASALASDDYIRAQQLPTISVAAAEDM